MNELKKILCLFLITVLFSRTTNAQSLPGDQRIIITNFKVHETNNQLIINWATEGTVAINYWELQRSTDGRSFSTFAIVMGPDPRQQGDHYEYKGKPGGIKRNKNYYRLCPVDKDGKEIINEIIPAAK